VLISITCRCGEQFELETDNVARRIRCRCGRVLKVPRRGSPPPSPTQPRSSIEEWKDGLLRQRGATQIVATQLDRILKVASWTYLLAVFLIALVIWNLGDRWWLGTALLFIGRWVFLLPLVALLPAALFAAPRALAPLMIATFVVVGPVMGMRTGWRQLPSARPLGEPVRVVSYNVAGGEQMAGGLPGILYEMMPDVLAMQECGSKFASSLAGLRGWHHHVTGNLCLLSRHPIQRASVMDRSSLKAVGSGHVVRYIIDTGAGRFELTNLHLETPRKGLERIDSFDIDSLRFNTRVREIESDLARRWVDAGQGESRLPIVVVGDFNTPVESRVYQEHWGDLRNAFSRTGIGLGVTRYSGWIHVRIDHILIGRGWHATSSVVGRDYGSDHRPVIADLTLLSSS